MSPRREIVEDSASRRTRSLCDDLLFSFARPGATKQVFDERYLVLSIDAGSNPITFNGGHPIGDFPLVNQQLLPLMIYESGLTEVTSIRGISSQRTIILIPVRG